MDDLDHNYFLLLGGNDGWLGSANLIDQVPMWRRGEYGQMPLRPESVRDNSRYVMEFQPHRSTVLEKKQP